METIEECALRGWNIQIYYKIMNQNIQFRDQNQIQKFIPVQEKPIQEVTPVDLNILNEKRMVSALSQKALQLSKQYQIQNLFTKQVIEKYRPLSIKNYQQWQPPLTPTNQLNLTQLVQKTIFENVDALATTQFNIDIYTRDLTKLPNGKYVYEFIEQLLMIQEDNIYNVFEILVMNVAPFGFDTKERKRYFISIFTPILTFVGKILSEKFAYLVDPVPFWRLISLPYTQPLLVEQENLKLLNTKNVNVYVTEIAKRNILNQNEVVKQFKKYTAEIVRRTAIRGRPSGLFFTEIQKDQWINDIKQKVAVAEQKQILKNKIRRQS